MGKLMQLPESLLRKLQQRERENAKRQLSLPSGRIDFSSNNYLGFARDESLFKNTHALLLEQNQTENGATGSRLISGNSALAEQTEGRIAAFHQSESALFYATGYNANLGLLGCVPQRGDIVLYDELAHASLRDGMALSKAHAFKFGHNDPEDLETLLMRHAPRARHIYVVTETVFSMDGDTAPLEPILQLCDRYSAYLIVDEAHALGVFGPMGAGLVQQLGVQDKIFARVVTYGKALGVHGAAVLGSAGLRDYLINFSRPFIYTTAPPPHSFAAVQCAYDLLHQNAEPLAQLRENINYFNREKQRLGLSQMFVRSKSAIQSAIIPTNKAARLSAQQLQNAGFDVKAILSPTVPEGQERLRICLHSFNTAQEIDALFNFLLRLVV